MEDEIPLFSIIFKSSSNQDLKEEESTTLITEDEDEDISSLDVNYKSNEDELDLEEQCPSSSQLKPSDIENFISSNKFNLPQNPENVKENYMPSDILDVEIGNEYDTEEVSSEELSFDEDLLDPSHLVSTTDGFEVYSVPMSSVYEALEKNKNLSDASSVPMFIKSSVDEYRKKLKQVKLRGAKYRKKIRILEQDCADLRAKVKNMQNLIEMVEQRKKKPKLTFINTLDFFEMDSDDDSS